MKWLALMAGGGFGAILRYTLSISVDQRMAASFPLGTFAVNVLGCFVTGILATWLDQRGISSPTVRLFWVTGLLGAFTTFSTFSFETMKLIENGKMLHATANAAGSVVACVFAVMAGIAIARAL